MCCSCLRVSANILHFTGTEDRINSERLNYNLMVNLYMVKLSLGRGGRGGLSCLSDNSSGFLNFTETVLNKYQNIVVITHFLHYPYFTITLHQKN